MIISVIGILNSSWNNKKIIKGKVNVTKIEVVVIIPIISDNFPPTKLITKGAPNPVDIPDNNVTGKANLGSITIKIPNITTGIINNFVIDKIIISFGLLKAFFKSLGFNRIKFTV